ncbi:uncharacterized protein [Antedon mediterranea]|uniref:uncharacterized protein n=1 Tax=Antedon mediterranea TaxID=105859 RepID=UPI003AF917D7
MSKDVLSKIREIDEDVANILTDGGVTNEDMKDICYEALGELIPTPGIKGILLRSKIWKVLSSEFHEEKSVEYSEKKSDFSVSLPGSSTSEFRTREWVSQAKSPKYTVYQDKDVSNASNSGQIPSELRHRIIRGTVNNMISIAHNSPWNRLPTNDEIMEMAKSVVITYPSLKDQETKHGLIYKQLKKRMYNVRGSKKKTKKSSKTDDGFSGGAEELESGAQTQTKIDVFRVDKETDRETDTDDSLLIYEPDNKGMMERHYNALFKECGKSKPSVAIINSYLNKEFVARRAWLTETSAESRCSQLLTKYPCFKDHVEIIEEVRRILGIGEGKARESFLKKCLASLSKEKDSIVYFGMSKKNTSPPSGSKITHILTNLSTIFVGNKSTKMCADLVDNLKDHEDPETWASRRSGNVPVLLLTKEMSYIVVGRAIVATMEITKLDEALVTFLATFYLLDIDYPKAQEVGLTILQQLVLGDTSTPVHLAKAVELSLVDYNKFKSSN